ncbi:MAG: VOC family protein [Sandaracinaceae bacterium]
MAHPRTTIDAPVPELPVRDVAEAQAYYRDKLGFEVAWTYPDAAMGAVTRGPLAIFFRRATSSFEPRTHWMFAEDVDATYREMVDRGADIVDDLGDKPWRLRQFTIADLNGHRFHIHHDLDE